jgi:hypothetical protein
MSVVYRASLGGAALAGAVQGTAEVEQHEAAGPLVLLRARADGAGEGQGKQQHAARHAHARELVSCERRVAVNAFELVSWCRGPV